MLNIYIDADACPVKEGAFRVAKRYSLQVYAVSNTPIFLAKADYIHPVVVEKKFDAVDDWIEQHAEVGDIVITNDLLLADRCLKKGSRVVDPRGRILTADNIGDALADREIKYHLREMGALDLGPKKMGKGHKSNFLDSLDRLINQVRRDGR